jgi:hypothetical protein
MHPPDRIFKKKELKKPLHWKSSPSVFIGLNRVEVLVLLLPHVGGNLGPGMSNWACYFRGPPLTTGWWDPAVCHEPYVNVNNLGCDPLSTSGP